MGKTQTWFLLFFTASPPVLFGSSDFHFVNLSMTFENATSYCRQNYDDLATIENIAKMAEITSQPQIRADRAWIGLKMGTERKWHWALPDQNLTFSNWKAGEPQNNSDGSDLCAAMNSAGEWIVRTCSDQLLFLCNGSKELSTDVKSWREAQNECRKENSELVSIQSKEDNEAVNGLASSDVWIGLFSDRWAWSSGSNSSFRYWKLNRPNNLNSQLCVATILRDMGKWNNRACTRKFPIFCQGAQQSTMPPLATTQMSSQQTVTAVQTSTTAPNLTSPPTTGNVILVQQNMTWVEAMTFCRMYNANLVQISSRELQSIVAEKTKNATSPHVWLGLRYTCKFDFWFWTRPDPGCYQNWASGHGPGMKYDCGFAGAIETTGGQQWVGLDEKKKLNFLCYKAC